MSVQTQNGGARGTFSPDTESKKRRRLRSGGSCSQFVKVASALSLGVVCSQLWQLVTVGPSLPFAAYLPTRDVLVTAMHNFTAFDVAGATSAVVSNNMENMPISLARQQWLYPFHMLGNLTSHRLREMAEEINLPPSTEAKDRRPSYPFVTGDGFRAYCSNAICENDECNFDLPSLPRGSCIFVKWMPSFLNLLKDAQKSKTAFTPPYVFVSHNLDHSYPKTPKLVGIPNIDWEWDYTDFLESDIVHHWFASNCDWRGSEQGAPKPAKLTCIPLGIENRYNAIGKDPSRYIKAMEEFPMDNTKISFVSFGADQRKPERGELLKKLDKLPNAKGWIAFAPPGADWEAFARSVRLHRFVFCPRGYGRDTHRLWETLILGAIPVVLSSTLDGMYEGLPVVILKDWNELTEDRLESEWQRIKDAEFELDKLFWPYWEADLKQKIVEARNSIVSSMNETASVTQEEKEQ